MKCPICLEDDPSQFGICRARPSGRNLYCKSCIRAKVYAGRDRKREMLRRVREVLSQVPERKPKRICIPAMIQVKRAIEKGCRTREEIKQATKLDWDALGKVLLHLTYESNQLEIVRTKTGERYFQFRIEHDLAA